jgi:hypothetical protein
MAIDHSDESRPRRHSPDVSHWDQTSWEDFFHPDWEDDAPRPAEGPATDRASLRSLTAPQPLNRPLGVIRQTTWVRAGGGIVMGTVVLIATAFMLGRVSS